MRTATLSGVFVLALTSALAATGAATPADEPAKPMRVLLMPFESLSSDSDAVARVIQRSLLLELNRLRKFHAVESKKVAADAPDPVAEGKAQNASFVVSASVQLADGRVRVIGQVRDLQKEGESAEPSHFKLTGAVGELFEFQDLLAEQVHRRMMSAPPATNQTAERVEVPPSEPIDVAVPRSRRDVDDAMQYRYSVLQDAYWCGPYGYSYGRRAYRPIYEGRYSDYIYRGLPDRRYWCSEDGFYMPPYYTFNCPIPVRWMRW